MDALAPAVVAVVVADDPGSWFEESLRALAAQDYDEFAVLVLVPPGAHDPSARLAEILPQAFVRTTGATSFGAAVNEVLSSVEGAAFFLVCHDDVALEPGATRQLVEESFRSNAGIVVPKMAHWEDGSVLLHVGQGMDKTGALVDRVQPGEVDHGQHDSVRDVFVAPGGCVLVRADLLRELGGYDAGMRAIGEDADLSWRAQIAGARVVVAPEARARHLEALLTGVRSLGPRQPDDAESGEAPGRRRAGERDEPPELQLERLRRRHELRSVLKCYSWWHLLRVLPQIVLLNLVEVVVMLIAGDGPRAATVTGAWRWNLGRMGELRTERRAVKAIRAVPDRQVRRLQTHGSVRLSAFLSQMARQGFELVQGRGAFAERDEVAGEAPELTGSVGGAFSEDDSFDEIGDRSRVRRAPWFTTPRSRLLAWLVVAVFLLVGSRQLLSGGLPVVGGLLPLGSWSGAWAHWASGWQPAGVGTTQPASPAFAVLGLVGTVLFGGMGLVQKVLVLGCIPVGAWGIVRMLRPLCSPRARVAAGLAYLGLPLAYDALARGRWDGLVAFAVTPWVVARVARASSLDPFTPPTGWRGSTGGQMLILGVVEAVAVGFAPGVAVVVALVGVSVPLGSLLAGRAGGWRGLVVAAGATVVAALLVAPWVIGIVLSGHSALGIFGLRVSAANVAGWSGLLRFDVGPTGGSVVSWFLVAAALLPLVIGRRARGAWSVRLWVLGLLSWVLAWVTVRGWLGSFVPSTDVLLAPAACAVAANIGIGLSAFEHDLGQYRFGWRQLLTVGAVAVAGVGLLPVVVEAADGRWGLPPEGVEQTLSYLSAHEPLGGSRVLWLADPAALPGGGWAVQPGLAYATTDGGTPSTGNLWAPAGAGPADRLASAIRLAEGGRTSQLGVLLADAGIRYIVVMNALAPSAPGVQTAAKLPTPPALDQALVQQGDLRVVPGGEGFTVYQNTSRIPVRAQRPLLLGAIGSGSSSADTAQGGARQWPTAAEVSGWHGVLEGAAGGTSFTGRLTPGPVVAAYAPAGGWKLTVRGRTVSESSAFGWAAQYRTVAGGPAVLSFSSGGWATLGVLWQAVVWFVVAAALLLVGRRRAHQEIGHE